MHTVSDPYSTTTTNDRYNYIDGVNFYNLRKRNRPFNRVIETAKEMTRECLPIRCLDACFLGIFLTQSITGLCRMPLKFKTRIRASGQVFRHIVLAVSSGGLYGAIGMSRRQSLMYKALRQPVSLLCVVFPGVPCVDYHVMKRMHCSRPHSFTEYPQTLSSLVRSFMDAYDEVGHDVLRVIVGLPLPHETSTRPVCWKFLSLNAVRLPWDTLQTILDRYSEEAADIGKMWYSASEKSLRRAQKQYEELDSGEEKST